MVEKRVFFFALARVFSLLSIHDNNRRTAHVVSRWFSQLFVLRKRDLQDVLIDYPEAAETLRKKAM